MQTHESGNLLYDLLTEPRFRPLRHLLLAAVLICVAFGQSFSAFGSHTRALGNPVCFFGITLTAVYIALTYFNLYYLAPPPFAEKQIRGILILPYRNHRRNTGSQIHGRKPDAGGCGGGTDV